MAQIHPQHPDERLRQHYAELTPELQRAADWVLSHPAEVGLWSMRRQANALAVSPATMLRLARSIGYPSYNSFRLPFQKALATPLSARVQQVQTAHRRKGSTQLDQLLHLQLRAVSSVTSLNAADRVDTAARAVLDAGRVGFLGSRVCYALAFQLNYAYHFLKGNGLLLDDMGGTLAEQIHALERTDCIVMLGLAPYSRSTLDAAQLARQRGTTLIALTDSLQSPLATMADHVLTFGPDPTDRQAVSHNPATFFHTVTGATALAEQLLARIAALGGKPVLQRAAQTDKRLHQIQAYWEAPGIFEHPASSSGKPS